MGDIRSREDVQKALQGVDTVFHTAGLISFGTHPDIQGMEEINVKGMKYSNTYLMVMVMHKWVLRRLKA